MSDAVLQYIPKPRSIHRDNPRLSILDLGVISLPYCTGVYVCLPLTQSDVGPVLLGPQGVMSQPRAAPLITCTSRDPRFFPACCLRLLRAV